MIPSDIIVNVNEADFEQQVLLYSQQKPVLVDFWAEWCAPCRVLGPILEKLANEAGGNFRLAKVDVDPNQKLALRYDVRSIPVVKSFKDGIVVSEFMGAQPEPQVREFLRELIPSESDLLLEKASSLLVLEQYADSEETYRQILDTTPDNTPALLGLAKSLLHQGKSGEASEILKYFPTSREQSDALLILPLATELNKSNDSKDLPDNHLEAAYINSLRLVKRGYLEPALDGLLDILRQDKDFKDGELRRVILAILGIMDPQKPQTREYRNELASILF